MTQEEKSRKIMQAEEKLRQAKAQLAKVKQEERTRLRKEQNHLKFMLGGVVVKYFPEAYQFSEAEMNRIIACAFQSRDVKNMIDRVSTERKEPIPDTDGMETEDAGFEETEDDEDDLEEDGDDGGDSD